MATIIRDSTIERQLQADRAKTGADRYDEVWEGTYIMAPLPNDEHQEIVSKLVSIFEDVVGWPGLGKVRPGVNVSDRDTDWQQNYRIPDVAVLLAGSKAKNHGAFWLGGPDFVVEILSPDDQANEMLPFYATVGVREVLLVGRDPWRLELYQLAEEVPETTNQPGGIGRAGVNKMIWSDRFESTEENPMTRRMIVGVAVLPIAAFASLAAGAQAPRVAIVAAATNTANAQTNPRFTDPRDVLVADGRFSQVDIISTTPFGGGGTPTLNTLLQYDAVLHWTNDSNADSVSLGNVLADYVDAGGGVVVAVFANTSLNPQRYLQGRWIAEDYEVIPSQGGHLEGPVPGTSGSSGHVSMSTVLEPDHPIFEDVGDVRLNWTTSTTGLRFGAHRPVTTAIHPWARKLALWEDDKTAVAVHENYVRRVDLGIHPVSDLVNAGYYDRTSDAGRLIANAMYYSATVGVLTGDFNGDGIYDCLDIDDLTTAIASGGPVADFDLNGDGQLTVSDIDEWLAEAGGVNLGAGRSYLVGDANLDGRVDGADFNRWNASKFTSNSHWCDGDFTADGEIDGADFNRWNANKFQSSDAAITVPEPVATLWAWTLLTAVVGCRRRASQYA